MITFSAIAHFVSRIEVLKNVRRGVYATVDDEVSAAFRGVSIEQIRQNYDIYPKNGPMQQLDIEDSLVVDLVKQYTIEKEQGLLTVMDINS